LATPKFMQTECVFPQHILLGLSIHDPILAIAIGGRVNAPQLAMKLLCLSNGHGEDVIALRLLRALQTFPNTPELAALPLVGKGHAFAQANIPLAGPVKQMPSGGFVYMDSRQLARDVRGGLLSLTLAQMRAVKQWAKTGGVVLAVGDIVPLLFAWWSGAPYAFVGTAKSEYYLRDEQGPLRRTSWFERLESWSGSVYLPWERWLMSRRRCRAVFPRDSLTTKVLQQWSIPAFDLGNPMMDGLEPAGVAFPLRSDLPEEAQPLTVVLLPGSRPPEAYRNWGIILRAVEKLKADFCQRALLCLGAIAPSLNLHPLRETLHHMGWQSESEDTYSHGNATLELTQSAFNDCLHQSDVALAMAGTATEQFVGLGKPALIFPGEGPQFTPRFAEAQSRLLGPSVILLQHPDQTPEVVRSLLQDPDRLQLIGDNGHRRMGYPGASERIATVLMERLLTRS
jgi:uncharacterized protein (TIGR03492 family)